MTKAATYVLQPGTVTYVENEKYTIIQIIDFQYALVKSLEDDAIKRVLISELSMVPPNQSNASQSIIAIPDEDWQIAQQRMEIIQPLIYKPGRTKADVEERASQYNLHSNSIYKWLRLYENSGLLTSLTPNKRKDKGQSKLSDAVEEIIKSCIETEYLTAQRKSIPKLHLEVKKACLKANLPVPHCNTVRNRVAAISEETRIRKRYGNQMANAEFEPNKGEFPGADYPYAYIQIDHTPLDIILVDDEYRLPLSRPWITLAIDVFSRMVAGFYLSFDPPGAIGTGMCMAHTIMAKDKWLADHDIVSPWPCWGIPRAVHADNAKEFRGAMLKRACNEYKFDLEWRPVGKPQYGAHVERLLGTFNKEIQNLPGTTFANYMERKEYDSEKKSAFTIKEFERWLTIFICDVYHKREHSSLKCSPLKKYEEGIFGSKQTKGIGLPPRVSDEHTLYLNFLPVIERTIQDYGVRIDGIYYYHDVLRVWVGARVNNKTKLKRQFYFRRDPRDISTIWFYDPELETYYPIPYRNNTMPPMTLWEFKKITGSLKEQNLDTQNEQLIIEAYERMTAQEQESVLKTKSSRRAIQRRKSSKENVPAIKTNANVIDIIDNTELNTSNILSDDISHLAPFDDMEELG